MSSRFLIYLFLISSFSGFAQTKLIKTLKEEDKIESSYHLYPSTLRMINLQNDPAFDELIRPVKKLSFSILKPDVYTSKDMHTAYQELLNEGYEEYIEVVNDSASMFVVGNESKSRTCILVNNDEEYYIADLEGMINVLKLGEVYESIANQDTSKIGLGTVFNYVMGENNEKRERAKRRKEREKNGEKEAKKESFQVTIGEEDNEKKDTTSEQVDSLNAIEEKKENE